MKIYENDEIYVRPLRQNDVEKENYLNWFYDQEVCKYNSHGKMSHSNCHYQHVDFHYENQIIWAVIKKSELITTSSTPEHTSTYSKPDLHIGNTQLNINWINRNAEFTCIFGEKEYWGIGYCTQVLKWIIEHGFNKLNLYKIWLGTIEGNIGMQRAAINCSMIIEATLPDHVFIDGKFKKIIRYSILKNEQSWGK